jgi:amino acid transporter
MTHSVLIYTGSLIGTVWGIGHLVATRSVVQGFGPISDDNRRIITMEWILEGLTLCFLGVLPATMAATGNSSSGAGEIVLWACAAMLLTMAMVSAATGARTSVAPMRACPYVKTAVALLFVVACLIR